LRPCVIGDVGLDEDQLRLDAVAQHVQSAFAAVGEMQCSQRHWMATTPLRPVRQVGEPKPFELGRKKPSDDFRTRNDSLRNLEEFRGNRLSERNGDFWIRVGCVGTLDGTQGRPVGYSVKGGAPSGHLLPGASGAADMEETNIDRNDLSAYFVYLPLRWQQVCQRLRNSNGAVRYRDRSPV
jgi:hypothetical protein